MRFLKYLTHLKQIIYFWMLNSKCLDEYFKFHLIFLGSFKIFNYLIVLVLRQKKFSNFILNFKHYESPYLTRILHYPLHFYHSSLVLTTHEVSYFTWAFHSQNSSFFVKYFKPKHFHYLIAFFPIVLPFESFDCIFQFSIFLFEVKDLKINSASLDLFTIR